MTADARRVETFGPHAALLRWVERHHGVRDPGEVTWRHAVNSRAAFERALGDPSTMAIEVDISRSASDRIVAAHPPATESDLSLGDLLDRMAASGLILKLDLKDPGIVEPVLAALARALLPNPVVLNADVLALGGAPRPRFDGSAIIDAVRAAAPSALLSLGWSTTATSRYTGVDVEAMAALTSDVHDVTFPVRADLVRRAPGALELLAGLLDRPGRTLTLWAGEPREQGLLEWSSRGLDRRRTFVDLG